MIKKEYVGVIVGRFQVPSPTSGHYFLFEEIKKRCTKLIVFIGKSPVSLTNKNPLSVYYIQQKVKSCLSKNDVVEIVEDNPSDRAWSENLDKRIINIIGHNNGEYVTLYGSRDSFISHYKGVFKTTVLSELPSVNATKIRNKIAEEYKSSHDFQCGLIYAIENKFPTAYPTVDIAIINKIITVDKIDYYILLGRKKKYGMWIFPGGFVDPSDASLEDAAKRELGEEITGIKIEDCVKYVSSMKIPDYRYRGTKDGVITSLFITNYLEGTPKAGDDLDEVHWFKLNGATRAIIENHHKPLYDKILKYLDIK